LFKFGLPVSFSFWPAAYIYVRSVLLGELKFRKYDWWMLVPAVMYTIILFPFYIMSADEKRAIISEFLKDQYITVQVGEGMITHSFFHFSGSHGQLFFDFKFQTLSRNSKKIRRRE
jgi:hypothetical protein